MFLLSSFHFLFSSSCFSFLVTTHDRDTYLLTIPLGSIPGSFFGVLYIQRTQCWVLGRGGHGCSGRSRSSQLPLIALHALGRLQELGEFKLVHCLPTCILPSSDGPRTWRARQTSALSSTYQKPATHSKKKAAEKSHAVGSRATSHVMFTDAQSTRRSHRRDAPQSPRSCPSPVSRARGPPCGVPTGATPVVGEASPVGVRLDKSGKRPPVEGRPTL